MVRFIGTMSRYLAHRRRLCSNFAISVFTVWFVMSSSISVCKPLGGVYLGYLTRTFTAIVNNPQPRRESGHLDPRIRDDHFLIRCPVEANVRSGACLVCQHWLSFFSRRPCYNTLKHLKVFGCMGAPVCRLFERHTSLPAPSGPLFGSGEFDEFLGRFLLCIRWLYSVAWSYMDTWSSVMDVTRGILWTPEPVH